MPPAGYGPYGYAPREMPYDPTQPIPPGYQVESRVNRGLVIAGGVTFASTYGLSVLASIAFATESQREADRFLPLLVPLGGPFITIGTSDAKGTETMLLLMDGLGQVAGVTMFIIGMTSKTDMLVRSNQPTGAVPNVLLGASSGALQWVY